MRVVAIVLFCLTFVACENFQTPTSPVTSFEQNIGGATFRAEMSPELPKIIKSLSKPVTRSSGLRPIRSNRTSMTIDWEKNRAWQVCRELFKQEKIGKDISPQAEERCSERFPMLRKEFSKE